MSERALLGLSLVLAVLGWFALGTFTYHNAPVGWNLWIATAIVAPTLWTSFLPLTHALLRRREHTEDTLFLAARRSALAALYFTLCMGLRIVGGLNWASAALLLGLFAITEILLTAR